MTSSALMNISDPVPAITEAGATGEIAAIFADIRLVLGVDVVNLIWRHLATIPGALPWAWGTLRPLYADGSIAAEAAALQTQPENQPAAIHGIGPIGGPVMRQTMRDVVPDMRARPVQEDFSISVGASNGGPNL